MSRRAPEVMRQEQASTDQLVHRSNAQSSQIIDHVWHTNKLDELENALNLISPHKFSHATAGDHANGKLAFQGQSGLGVFRVSIGRDIDVTLESEASDDRMAFVMAASGAGEFIINGKAFSHTASRAIIMTSGPKRMLRFAEQTETRVFITSREKVAECCARLLGHDIPGFVNFDFSADLEAAAGRSWLRLLSYVETELSDPHSFIRYSPSAWRQFEQQLLTGFLLSHRHDYTQALLAPQAAAVPFYVKRVEDFIESHFAEPLSLADLAAHAGVSARSLQSGFQNFRNITPMGFLRATRLRRAHEALSAADPVTATVAQIAMACGFTHLGEFGTAYRRVFGVTPSQTLQKKPQL